jgi:white-opaque regulator 2
MKSKRECLGYDPIFKPQSPSSIQPAQYLLSPASPNAAFHPRPPSYTSPTPLSRPQSSATENTTSSVDPNDFRPLSKDLCLGRANSVTASTETMDDSDMRRDAHEHPRAEDQTIRRGKLPTRLSRLIELMICAKTIAKAAD